MHQLNPPSRNRVLIVGYAFWRAPFELRLFIFYSFLSLTLALIHPVASFSGDSNIQLNGEPYIHRMNCEFAGYACDITRTYARSSGRFADLLRGALANPILLDAEIFLEMF